MNLALALEGKAKAADAETKQLVALAQSLATLPEPEIDVSFADELEQLLLTDGIPMPAGRPQLTIVRPAEREETTPRAPVVQMPRRRYMVRRSVAGIAAAASLAAFPVVAAAKSLPGSPFYGLKQRIHALQLAAFGGAVQDAYQLMEYAQEHISEAEQLASMPNPDQSLIAMALQNAADKIARAERLILGSTRNVAELKKFAAMARETAASAAGLPIVFSPESHEALRAVLRATTSAQQSVNLVLGLNVPILQPKLQAKIDSVGTSGQQTASNGRANSQTSKPASSKPPTGPGPNDRTGKTLDEHKQKACQTIGGAQLGDTVLKPITDPTCHKPGANI